jgi:hypothetical protein
VLRPKLVILLGSSVERGVLALDPLSALYHDPPLGSVADRHFVL